MNRPRRIFPDLLAAVFVAVLALCAPAAPGQTKAVNRSLTAASSSDPVLQAMLEEMARSKSLKMENVPPPYYIECRISDMDEYDADAAFGALRGTRRTRARVLRAVVRVGDYKQDSYFGSGMGQAEIVPLDDDPVALRRQIWLATDSAYKAASEALTAKQALLKEYTPDQPVDDFAQAPVVESIGPLAVLEVDPKHWEGMLEHASALFRTDPQVESLETSLHFRALNQYFVNSEGTVTRQGSLSYVMTISGATQAADGMRLERNPYTMTATLKELPTPEQFQADAVKMLDTLKKLREAPVVEEEFRGPVIFAPDAASDVFASLVGANAAGRKPRPGESARTTGGFAASYKSRVLPEFLSVTDDPTLASFQGHTLAGAYQIDDEGVKASVVRVIQDGELVNYLLGREPIRDFPASNGHGRAGPGAPPFPSAAVLVIQTKAPVAPEDLKKKMLEMCRNARKPYGYIVETLGPRLSPRLLYRVWEKDGREELVRGAVFNELDTRALRNDLVAAGSDSEASNKEGSLPNTVICPSVLFDELEVKRIDTKNSKLPEYPAPPLVSSH